MTAIDAVRRRRTALTVAGGVVAAILLVAAVLVGIDTLRNSKEGRRANDLPPGRTLPPTPAALLAVQGDDGQLSSLVVLALAPPGADGVARGGTILPMPVGAGLLTGTDPQLHRLADLYAEEGVEGLAEHAGSLLSVNFSLVSEVDRGGLAELLAPLGALRVSFPRDVVVTLRPDEAGSDAAVVDTTTPTSSAGEADEPTGVDTTLYTAGEQTVDPESAAALLAGRRDGEAESVRFENAVAYWSAVQGRVAGGLGTAPQGSATATMPAFLRALWAGPVRVYPLRGEAISRGPENPDGVDLYLLNTAEVIRVMATVLPDAISPVDVVFTVQVINPTGDPRLTQKAVERLAFGGVGIVLVRELTGVPVPAVTEVSLGGRADLAEVQPYTDNLGETRLVPIGQAGTPHGRVQGVDVNIVLGASFAALVERQEAATVTTANTTIPAPAASAPDTTEGAA